MVFFKLFLKTKCVFDADGLQFSVLFESRYIFYVTIFDDDVVRSTNAKIINIYIFLTAQFQNLQSLLIFCKAHY